MNIIDELVTTNDALPSRKEKARYVEDVSMSSDSDDEHSIIKQVKVTQKLRAIKPKLSQSMKSCTVPLGEQKVTAITPGFAKDIAVKKSKMLKNHSSKAVVPSPYDGLSRQRNESTSMDTDRPATISSSVPLLPKGDPPSLPTPNPVAVPADSHLVKTPPRLLQKRRARMEHRNSPSNKEPQPSAIDVNVGGVDTLTSHQKPDASQSRLKRLRDDPTSNSSAVGSSSHKKRPKAAVVPKFSKHPVHWAPDGNTLVQIKEVRFQLHRSRLEKQSDWFRDYFNSKNAVARLGDAGEMRAILLDDIGVELADFEILLDALDNFVPYFYDKPSFGTVASILRASTKLSFNNLSTWSSQYFQDMWPTSLQNVTTTQIPFAAESLELARQWSIPSIRKRAMYELVRIEAFGQVTREGDRHGITGTHISPYEFAALLRAREKLTSLWIVVAGCSSANQKACAPGTTECTSSKPRQRDHVHTQLVHRSGIFQAHIRDPICGLQSLVDAPWGKEGFCEQCVAIKKEQWGNTREELWKDLDLWFGLTAPTA